MSERTLTYYDTTQLANVRGKALSQATEQPLNCQQQQQQQIIFIGYLSAFACGVFVPSK